MREATHQVADAVSRDWMQRADVEMQLRLTTESEKVELEKQLGAMQRRLGE